MQNNQLGADATVAGGLVGAGFYDIKTTEMEIQTRSKSYVWLAL